MKDKCTDSFFLGGNNTDNRQEVINIFSSGARLFIFMRQGYLFKYLLLKEISLMAEMSDLDKG